MKHIKQIGGTRKVKGTSITQEATNASLKAMAVLALLFAYGRNRSIVHGHLSSVIEAAKYAVREGMTQIQTRLLKYCNLLPTGWMRRVGIEIKEFSWLKIFCGTYFSGIGD
jgi:hypothetical protein